MKETFNEFCEIIKENYQIRPELYSKYNAKRGLRNEDGTGVLVGLTNIGNVHGYTFDEGDKIPDDGCLSYRGIDVADLIENCQKENRFGYEEAAYLLLFGKLPTEQKLNNFKKLLGANRELPAGFTEDMILKAPSSDIMNKLARSVLVSYSYDENPDGFRPSTSSTKKAHGQHGASSSLLRCCPAVAETLDASSGRDFR